MLSKNIKPIDNDKEQFKKLIKQCITGISFAQYQKLTSRQQELNLKLIDAYTVAFYVNFQPTLITVFIKTIIEQL